MTSRLSTLVIYFNHKSLISMLLMKVNVWILE